MEGESPVVYETDMLPGWWLGLPEFLEEAGLPEDAERLAAALANREEEGRIEFGERVEPLLDEFFFCRFCRSKLN